MRKPFHTLKIFTILSLIGTVQSAQADTANLEKLLIGKSATLQMKLGNTPADRLPDGVSFRQNDGANIADFTKTGSDRKRKLLWEVKSGKFCMKPLLKPSAKFVCYKVSTKENVIKLTARPKVKDSPEQMIITLN